MATIKKKLIHFEKLSDFQTRLNDGDISSVSIVWIKDANKIWTHDNYYNCDDPDLSNYLTASLIANLYLGKTDKAVSASTADSATKATQDASGNTITSTYATKAEVTVKYTKPSSGIPKTDLVSAVLTSLDKADNSVLSDGNILNIKKVSALPSSPNANTLYIIVE